MTISLRNLRKRKIPYSTERLGSIMQHLLKRHPRIDSGKEHSWLVALDEASTITHIELLSIGTLMHTKMYAGEVLRSALQKEAKALVLVHNHPSADLAPSSGDRETTGRLIQAAKLFHIPIIDHLIVSTEDYYSFHHTGLLHKLSEVTRHMPYYVFIQHMNTKYEAELIDG